MNVVIDTLFGFSKNRGFVFIKAGNSSIWIKTVNFIKNIEDYNKIKTKKSPEIIHVLEIERFYLHRAFSILMGYNTILFRKFIQIINDRIHIR